MNLIKYKYIPLIAVVGFNLFTLLVFYTAPIKWASNNLLELFLFVFACQIMIILGFRLGYRRKKKRSISKQLFSKLSPPQISFVFYFYIATVLIKYAYLLRFKMFDISGMFHFLLIGFADPHLGYALSLDESRPVTISWSIYLLVSVIDQIFFIIGFITWKRQKLIFKFVFIFFLLLEIFFWMGRGTNFGTISIITTLILALISSIKLNTKISLFRYSIVGVLFLALGLFAFTLNMSRRSGAKIVNFGYFDIGLSKVDEYSSTLKIIPTEFQESYLYIVDYLAQGYYHTSLAFDLDFRPTFFLGNNFAILSFAKLVGIDLWKETYVYRLREKGVDPMVNWHTAYLWFASDVSFLGVPILFLFLGFLFGYSWDLSLNHGDFLSKIIFIILGNIFLFLFANNTYLSSVFYSFFFILPYWLATRLRFLK